MIINPHFTSSIKSRELFLLPEMGNSADIFSLEDGVGVPELSILGF